MAGPWEKYAEPAAPWEKYGPAPAEEGSRARAAKQSDGVLTKAVLNLVPGLVRGAGSIGATLLAPNDMLNDAVAGEGLSLDSNRKRRAAMDAGLTELGADPSNPGYKVGKLGGEVAGTLGTGGVAANALALRGVAPSLVNAVRTGGMTAGAANPVVNLATRAAGGAINGGLSAGLVDPEQAGMGAALGGALPMGAKVAGEAGNLLGKGVSKLAAGTANRLMQSAIKPTIAQLKSGDAAIAVRTLLDNGINPTKGGVEKLRALIDTKNSEITNEIAGSTATVDPKNVVNALGDVRSRFGRQVDPMSDLNAITGVEDRFLAGPGAGQIPVQLAQDMKQGTYSVLRGKYGQLGSAETEAQKALARGLKDEIASAVPAVGPLNAEESRLLKTLSVTERRALMEVNKNPMGLAALAHNPVSWAVFMADKSALFKSLAARAVNSVAAAPNALGRLSLDPVNQLGYRAAPVLATDQ